MYHFSECQCYTPGTIEGSNICNNINGRCDSKCEPGCKRGYIGSHCNECNDKKGYGRLGSSKLGYCNVCLTEFYNANGAIGRGCTKEGFAGENCDECANGYVGYPDCHPCNKHIKG